MQLNRRGFIAGSAAAVVVGEKPVFGSGLFDGLMGPSAPLTGVDVGKYVRIPDNRGDTWIGAWAGDGNLYSPSDDTKGFHDACSANVAFNRLDGDDPLQLRGTTVNPMSEYGKEAQRMPDKHTWKSSGCMWLDGALYLVVGRHIYGEISGDAFKRQPAQNASIIKSTDFGKTWTRSAQQNYDSPMFPGRRFATPYFLQYNYGHEREAGDNAERYVYATSNNGFWDCGDDMVLGRVARSKIGDLKGSDWEYFTGGDGMKPASWSSKMDDAKPVLSGERKFGMTGAVYLRAHHRYFMINWYYPAGGGKMDGAASDTVWDFYDSPRPWGPWTKIGTYHSQPEGWYTPEVSPKFQSKDTIHVLTAGNWNDPGDYRLTVVPLKLRTVRRDR